MLDSAAHAKALDRLRIGEWKINDKRPRVEKREQYVHGEQELPFAPVGVSVEYLKLREQSIANWMDIWAKAPVQRLRLAGIRTGNKDRDQMLWTNGYQANQWDMRQASVYRSTMMHGRGLASVWPNAKKRARPIARPESFKLTHVQMNPDDPFEIEWVAKIYVVDDPAPSSAFLLPAGLTRTKTIGIVYDDVGATRFEHGGLQGGEWRFVSFVPHGMETVPFALFDYQTDEMGNPWSGLDHMIPQQDALNTIRFNSLLALQFSAFRQRIISGFDPRVRDANDQIIYRTDKDGAPLVDENGAPVPVLLSPGRPGVDRMIAFPGIDTKVYDLPESNMANYVALHENFLVNFFATGQIPPQYLLARMANLSGDALTGAESTFMSLLGELELSLGEGNERMGELMWRAMGKDDDWSPDTESVWADTEARSFAQVIDAIVKLISAGLPRRDGFAMIPKMTSQRLDEIMANVEEESLDARLAHVERQFVDSTAGAGPVIEDAA